MSQRAGDPGFAANWCVHYRAKDHKTCAAGVNYQQLGGVAGTYGMLQRFPCFLKYYEPARSDAVSCKHLRVPTREEVAAHDEWAAARARELLSAMVAIAPLRDQYKDVGFAGVIECPACQGRLHLTIAATNGHTHGKCETEGCLSWME